MKIIVPMAGTGARFVAAGYTEPKPLITVGDRRIIDYIVGMFSADDEFVFICNNNHLASTDMREHLERVAPGCKIVGMDAHKLGPVFTVAHAFNLIGDEEEVIVTYCDNPYLWNYADFKQFVRNEKLDGCVLTHSGFHPHTLANTKMAFLKEKEGRLVEIKEKECYTDTPQNEHASTGTYYFRRGQDVKKYFTSLMEKGINYNGEHYVTLVYNLLVEDGLQVGYYDTPYVMVFGTPEEVAQHEAWLTITKGAQIKTPEDAGKSYVYWTEYAKNLPPRQY